MTNTALIIIPEEAEQLIPLIHLAKRPLTHLLTYAVSVTRKMLQFNGFDYYATSSLPSGWEAPMWLTIELGILAGRLYFEFKEYNSLCQYLGSQQASKMLEENSEGTLFPVESSSTEEGAAPGALSRQSFTSRPLTFLQQ